MHMHMLQCTLLFMTLVQDTSMRIVGHVLHYVQSLFTNLHDFGLLFTLTMIVAFSCSSRTYYSCRATLSCTMSQEMR